MPKLAQDKTLKLQKQRVFGYLYFDTYPSQSRTRQPYVQYLGIKHVSHM